ERLVAGRDLDLSVVLLVSELLVGVRDRLRAVVVGGGRLVVMLLDPVVVAAPNALVIIDSNDVVLLGAEVDVLLALLVLEAEFVEILITAFEAAAALDAALRFVVGQLPRRHVLGIVDATDDDGLIGIAFEEINDDLMPDARNVDYPPILAGPGRRHADPAGAILVLLALAVPVELNLDAA